MNKQTNELLAILLNAPGQRFTYDALSEYLHVSTRTIRNYVQAIRDFLQSRGKQQLLTISDKGLSVSGTSAELLEVFQAVVDQEFYLYRLSPQERFRMILLTLLMNDDYCNISGLSEKFKVSRGTVLKDIDRIKMFLSHRGLKFYPLMNKGYLLDIRESERRSLMIEIAMQPSDSAAVQNSQVNIYRRFILDEYRFQEYIPAIEKLLLEVEREYQLNVSDVCFDEILLTLAVSSARMMLGRMIEEMHFDIPLVRDFVVFEIAESLLLRLQAIFHFSSTDQELDFLAQALYKCRFYNDGLIDNMQDMQMHMAVSGFLLQVGEELKIPFHKDPQTAEHLEKHLKDIAQAHREGIRFQNEYKEPMQREYPVYYEVVKRHVQTLETGIGFECSDDDVTFILFHVVAAAERYFQGCQKPRIIVVCHTGVGTANFLAEQLKNHFNIQILAVTSKHKLEEILKTYDFDLIVSTVTLNLQDFLWVKVSPMLEDNDILTLQKEFIVIKRKKRKLRAGEQAVPAAPEEKCVLKEENILLDVECRDWKEAISAAAEPLLKEGSIRPEYVRKMIESVKQNGTYFVYCPGVALAHAGPWDGVMHFGLSLIRLKHPVVFGHKLHDPVSYVLCLASREKDVRIQNVLGIMNLLGSPEDIKILNEITEPSGVLRYITEKEKEETYEQ